MNNIWKYKVDLVDAGVFEEIEKDRGIDIPRALKDFISDYNAATPEKHFFMINSDEKVFGAVLSFNKNEQDIDSVFTALDVVKDKKNIPFAIDPFGNYICLDVNSGVVFFWNHETEEFYSSKKDLENFINDLY